MELSSTADLQNLALLVFGGVFALAGLMLIFRPKREGHTAKLEIFGLKFEASSAGVLVLLIGSAFIGGPVLLQRSDLGSSNENGGQVPPILQSSIDYTLLDASEWELRGSDTFAADVNGWPTGTDTEATNTIRREYKIVGGNYRWELELEAGRSFSLESPFGTAVNFMAAVDVDIVASPESAHAGMALIFGKASGHQYYFALADLPGQGMEYGLHRLLLNGDVATVLTWTPVPEEIQSPERLAVLVFGSQAKLYIDGVLLGEILLPDYTGGNVGVATYAYSPGVYVYDFDNFEFRVGPASR